MRAFDFYEFTGILAPGAVVTLAILLVFPDISAGQLVKDFSLGGLGLFTVVAYVAGHLVQTIGNVEDRLWWKAWGGMPTDWVRSKRHELLAQPQINSLEEDLRESEVLSSTSTLSDLSDKGWHAITRQIYACVSAQGRAVRVDTFNGNYALNRGISASLLVTAGVFVVTGSVAWGWAILCVAGALLALYRMHRFGVHYGRELFVQYLALSRPGPSARKPVGDTATSEGKK